MASSCRSNVTRVAFRNVIVSERGYIYISLPPLLSLSLSLFFWRIPLEAVVAALSWRVARANGKVNHAFYYRLRGVPENSWHSLEKRLNIGWFSLSLPLSCLSALLSLSLHGERRDGLDTYLSRCRSNLPWVFLVSLVPFCSVDSATTCWSARDGRPKNRVNRFSPLWTGRLQESRFVWYRSCAETGWRGRGVVKVYRIFCLIVVICNVWILTIPLHVEFLCYVAIFTLSCFIPVFISYFDFFRSIKRRYKCSR